LSARSAGGINGRSRVPAEIEDGASVDGNGEHGRSADLQREEAVR
jgi:hypothetical protein